MFSLDTVETGRAVSVENTGTTLSSRFVGRTPYSGDEDLKAA